MSCLTRGASGLQAPIRRPARVRNGRSDRIRTCDPLTPSQVRYQAALRSDTLRGSALIGRAFGLGNASAFAQQAVQPRLHFGEAFEGFAKAPAGLGAQR